MAYTVEVYRHAAAKVIARQQSIVSDLAEYLKDVENMPYPILRVVKAVCLLIRTEVPNPDEMAAIVAKQFLESSILIKRLAELEEVTLPFSTLSKLGEIVLQDEFLSVSLPQSVLAMADCIKKLYDFQCSSRTEEASKPKHEAWLSPQRNLRTDSVSPVRVVRHGSESKDDEPLLANGLVKPDPHDEAYDEHESYEAHTKQVEELEARKQRQSEDLNKMRQLSERIEEHQSALKISPSDAKKDESLDKVLQKHNLATRTVKRVTPSDFERLRSFFNCPPCFAPYCFGLGALLVESAPDAFKSKRSSLGAYWAGLRTLLSKPPMLCQLLTEVDAWNTSSHAAEHLDNLQDVSAPVSQLAQASPAALALANWVTCFSDKWVELGRPIRDEQEEEQQAENGHAPDTRQLFATPARATTPRGARSSSRGRPPSRHRSPSTRRSASTSAATPNKGRNSVAQKEKEKFLAVQKQKQEAEEVRKSHEDALLKALIDIRTLTARDFALLATHTPNANLLSQCVQATVEGVTVMTGLGGDNPSDGTVDLWAVGITALQNQPQEVLEAIKTLNYEQLSPEIINYVEMLRTRMGMLPII
eukprot:TRINITY_DN2350_c0_g1_i6.p1 TRINITY_DN2350_c0_g1~~TRINITY_DN2350_c0_g1_i6.p1  ORF type:complete len:588 (+),score=143.93 TRINITY_DN2350_c0_g1_i6:376-2139(+)